MTKCEIIMQKVKMSEVLEKYSMYPSRNRNYLCCFHNDKRPSAMVSKDDRWWHCWSCGKNVNVIDFVAEKEGCNRSKAIKIINDMFDLGLDGKLTDSDKKELEIKKRAEELRKQREKAFKDFETKTLEKIIKMLKFWEQVQLDYHPTRGQIRNDNWGDKDIEYFFLSLKQQHWLNWLYDRICGFKQYDLGCEFDYIYGTDGKSILRMLYQGKISIF